MIPIQLTLKGIYSYQEEQQIDFGALTSAQLFGVFGKVGSGKSTLLEAITLALYGQVERIGATQNRNYNLMNLKSNELFISFTFENHDGKRYMYTVQAKRNSKRFSDVGTYLRKAFVWENADWQPLQTVDAKEVIGLSYENFKRTIIIPQGKFQEFLQLKDSERTDMLQEIFQLERFDLSPKVKQLEVANSDAIRLIEGQLMQLHDIGEEQLHFLTTEINERHKNRAASERKVQELRKKEEAQLQLRELHLNQLRLEEKLKILREKNAEIEKKQHDLNTYEHLEKTFKTPYFKKREAVERLTALQKENSDNTVLYVDLNDQLKRLKEAQSTLEPQLKQLPQLEQKQREYGNLVQLKSVHDKIQLLTKEAQLYAEQLTVKNTQFQDAEQLAQALRKSIANDNSQLSQWAVLDEITIWWMRTQQLVEQYSGAERHLTQKRRVLEEKKEIYASHFNRAEQVALPMESGALADYFAQKRTPIREAFNQLDAQIRHLEVQQQLIQFSDNLTMGDPCPLCGSEHHPKPLVNTPVKEELAQLKQQLLRTTDQLELLDKAAQSLNILLQELQFMEKDCAEKQTELAALSSAQYLHDSTYLWEETVPKNKAAYDEAFGQKRRLQEKIIAEQKQAEEVLSALEGLRLELEKSAKHHNELNTQLRELETAAKLHKESIQDASVLGDIDLSLSAIKAQSEHLKNEVDRINAQHKFIESEHLRLTAAFATAQTVKEQLDKQCAALSQQLSQLEEELNNLLINHPTITTELVENYFKQPVQLEDIRTQIEAHNKEVYSLEIQLKEIVQQLGEQAFEAEFLQVVQEQLKEAEEGLKTLDNELASLNTLLEKAQERWTVKQQLNAQFEALDKRKKQLAVLKKLFSGKGFVTYISRVYLNQLCAAANERFYKLTNQHLRLELNDKNGFDVRDYLNNGQVRHVRTLSGGQTFQASLCLALALAENLPHQQLSKQNFFFLDEGFGSLDKETLQLVFEALKSLRKEQRIVGIISHVEELQQEISTYLDIEKTENNGTVVRKSWE